MSQLNVFIDGTWLLNQLAAGGSFANATETPDRRFPFDFAKLNAVLVEHVRANGRPCEGVADCFISTSIFSLPPDFDAWPSQFEDISTDQIEKTRRAVAAREALVSSAAEAGYRQEAVFRPPIRD